MSSVYYNKISTQVYGLLSPFCILITLLNCNQSDHPFECSCPCRRYASLVLFTIYCWYKGAKQSRLYCSRICLQRTTSTIVFLVHKTSQSCGRLICQVLQLQKPGKLAKFVTKIFTCFWGVTCNLNARPRCGQTYRITKYSDKCIVQKLSLKRQNVGATFARATSCSSTMRSISPRILLPYSQCTWPYGYKAVSIIGASCCSSLHLSQDMMQLRSLHTTSPTASTGDT